MSTSTPRQARVLLDMFPAVVTVTAEGAEPRTVSRTRVVVTEEAVFVAADAPAGPMLIFRERHAAVVVGAKKEKDPSSVTTASGKVLAISKDDNCGCGSRLRSWSPYNTVYSSNDPVE